jgi:hypothetical protein
MIAAIYARKSTDQGAGEVTAEPRARARRGRQARNGATRLMDRVLVKAISG